MRILLFAEFLRRTPSAPSRWVLHLARGLAERGHAVTLALDGADDPGECDPVPVLLHDPDRDHMGADPFAFRAWARAVHAGVAHDVSLSLTPLVPADAELPVSPPSRAQLRWLTRVCKPYMLPWEIAHHRWLLPGVVAELRPSRGTRLRFGGAPANDDPCALGYASALPPVDHAQRDALRGALRRALHISADATVILCPAVHHERSGLASFLAGLASARAYLRERTPLVIAPGRRPHSVMRHARDAGCSDLVIPLKETWRIGALFAACDAVAIPQPRDDRIPTTARFAADALRCGRPVLAHPYAPGVSLLSGQGTGWVPGLIVQRTHASTWSEAIKRTTDPEWRERTTAAAEHAGESLGFPELLGRLERALQRRTPAPV